METLTALADWEAFFAAQLGASATLAGLLFVGISLNLAKILSAAFLPMRALLALSLLVAILLIASLMLLPGAARLSAAAGVLLFGGIVWLGGTYVEIYGWRTRAMEQGRVSYVLNAFLLQAATLPYLVGAGLLFSGGEGGLYWVAIGVILSTLKAVVDAWVLLVEINR